MKVLVHNFWLGDVEDPEIYAAKPLLDFEKTEKGQWLSEHSYNQLTYNIQSEYITYGYRVIIHAWLDAKDLTYYRLKWS